MTGAGSANPSPVIASKPRLPLPTRAALIRTGSAKPTPEDELEQAFLRKGRVNAPGGRNTGVTPTPTKPLTPTPPVPTGPAPERTRTSTYSTETPDPIMDSFDRGKPGILRRSWEGIKGRNDVRNKWTQVFQGWADRGWGSPTGIAGKAAGLTMAYGEVNPFAPVMKQKGALARLMQLGFLVANTGAPGIVDLTVNELKRKEFTDYYKDLYVEAGFDEGTAEFLAQEDVQTISDDVGRAGFNLIGAAAAGIADAAVLDLSVITTGATIGAIGGPPGIALGTGIATAAAGISNIFNMIEGAVNSIAMIIDANGGGKGMEQNNGVWLDLPTFDDFMPKVLGVGQDNKSLYIDEDKDGIKDDNENTPNPYFVPENQRDIYGGSKSPGTTAFFAAQATDRENNSGIARLHVYDPERYNTKEDADLERTRYSSSVPYYRRADTVEKDPRAQELYDLVNQGYFVYQNSDGNWAFDEEGANQYLADTTIFKTMPDKLRYLNKFAPVDSHGRAFVAAGGIKSKEDYDLMYDEYDTGYMNNLP